MTDKQFFPIAEDLPIEYYKNNSWKYKYTHNSKSYLHYEIILDNNVQPKNMDSLFLKDMQLTYIGRYSSNIKKTNYLEVIVAYEECSYEMNPSDWLRRKMSISGEQILNLRTIYNINYGTYLDALSYNKNSSGDEIISRFSVFKEYNPYEKTSVYFLVKASCRREFYDSHAYTLLHEVANFKLVNKYPNNHSQQFKIAHINNIENCSFYIPESWQMKYGKNNNSEISRYVVFHNTEEVNTGAINILVYKSNILESALDVFDVSFNRFKSVKGLTYSLGELTEISNKNIINPYLKKLFIINVEINSNADGFSGSVNINIIKTREAWYYVESVGPKPNLENYYWEVNQRCLELICNTLNNMGMVINSSFNKVQIKEVSSIEIKKNT